PFFVYSPSLAVFPVIEVAAPKRIVSSAAAGRARATANARSVMVRFIERLLPGSERAFRPTIVGVDGRRPTAHRGFPARFGVRGVSRRVSVRERLDAGAERDAAGFGPDPAGLLVYTSSGWVSVCFGARKRLPWKGEAEPTEAELASAGSAFSAYAGRYEVRSG